MPEMRFGSIPCLLCQAPVPATGRKIQLLNNGCRIFCKQCERRVKSARALFSSVLAKPFREMMSMARMIERRAISMIDVPEIRMLAQIDTPVYRDIIAEWSRVTGQKVDPLPRQQVLPPEPDAADEGL